MGEATAMVVGTIIGASIFVQPSEVTGQVPSVAGIFAVWLICGLLTLAGALVCAELASTFPDSGGVYTYLREAYSPVLGFLWGWAMFWTMHSGIIAAVATIFARYAGFFIPVGDTGTRAVAVAAVLVLSWVNYRGVRQGSLLQASFTWVKVGAILAIVVLGVALGGDAHGAAVAANTGATSVGGGAQAAGGLTAGTPAMVHTLTLGGFGTALVAGLFAFGGWHMVTYNAGETRDPRRTIPRALLVGTLLVTACYVALNAVYLYVLPFAAVARSTKVAADAADAVLGRGGGAILSGVVCFSAFGALSGIVLTGPRAYYAMARDGVLFRWAGEVHPRLKTPHRAIALQAVWASVLIATGTYRALFTRVIYTEWIFFGLMALGLIRLRRRSDVQRSYSMWGYPWTPALFALVAFAIVGNQIVRTPLESALGLGMVLVGLPVYHIWASSGSRRPVADSPG